MLSYQEIDKMFEKQFQRDFKAWKKKIKEIQEAVVDEDGNEYLDDEVFACPQLGPGLHNKRYWDYQAVNQVCPQRDTYWDARDAYWQQQRQQAEQAQREQNWNNFKAIVKAALLITAAPWAAYQAHSMFKDKKK